jgi:ornithine carbamoyltransferase
MESFIYGVLLLGESITLITPTGKFVGKNRDFNQLIKRFTKAYGGSFTVTKNAQHIVPRTDVLYVDEWWENSPRYLKRKIGKYMVDRNFLKNSKPTLSIMHCMPAHAGREISIEVLRSKRSIIYDQAEFRTYSAMALLSYLKK